jgi:micrococcal nuclease
MNSVQYKYRANVVKWVDGDTVDLLVDLGFYHFVKTRFRLYGIDTPERGDALWGEASDFAKIAAPEGTEVVIEVFKAADKYGRWLANIYLDGQNINESLVASGLAVPYFGGTKPKVEDSAQV